MLYFLIASSALVMSIINVDAACKSFLVGPVMFPIDFCVDAETDGISVSSKYVCDGSGGVNIEAYLGTGCSGSADYTAPFNVTSVVCSGDTCTAAAVREYESTTCATSDNYVDVPIATGECVSYLSTGVKYSCDNGNVTLWTYASTDCSGNATDSEVVYYTGKCDTDEETYYKVTCNAKPSSSGTIMLNISFIGMIISVIALFL